jgi:hypothetical protein
MGRTTVTAAVSIKPTRPNILFVCLEDSQQVGSMTESRDLPRCPEMRWPPALSPDSFPVNRINVWRVSLDIPLIRENKASVLLSGIARPNRFHLEKDRLHFIRCRAALRRLLGKYLTIPADEVRFQYRTNRKPQLGSDIRSRYSSTCCTRQAWHSLPFARSMNWTSTSKKSVPVWTRQRFPSDFHSGDGKGCGN